MLGSGPERLRASMGDLGIVSRGVGRNGLLKGLAISNDSKLVDDRVVVGLGGSDRTTGPVHGTSAGNSNYCQLRGNDGLPAPAPLLW